MADFSLPGERVKAHDPRHSRRELRLCRRLCGRHRAARQFHQPTCSCWALPGSAASCLLPATILEAIRLNGEAVTMNTEAFNWGRRACRSQGLRGLCRAADQAQRIARTLDIARRDDRAAREVPDRLSERRLCRALQGARRRRAPPRPRARPARRITPQRSRDTCSS